MADIEGVLFDIDGVLLTSWQPIEGAGEAVREVRRRGLACGFLTNTTSRSSSLIAQGLCDAGIEVEASQIVTAARLTGEYVRATYPDARAWVLNHGDVSADLEGIEFDDADPEVVILGGAGPEFTHEGAEPSARTSARRCARRRDAPRDDVGDRRRPSDRHRNVLAGLRGSGRCKYRPQWVNRLSRGS